MFGPNSPLRTRKAGTHTHTPQASKNVWGNILGRGRKPKEVSLAFGATILSRDMAFLQAVNEKLSRTLSRHRFRVQKLKLKAFYRAGIYL